jgi:preprotein translocase subunit SecB
MAEEQQAPQGPSLQVRAQYVKDLSFESPYSPQSLFSAAARPQIEVAVDLKAQKLQDDVFESVIQLSARAVENGNSLFLVEIAYGGVFQITGIPEEHIERVLLIDAPFIMFPFLRRVVSDVTRDGGFPPLMLDPIDFAQIYDRNRSRTAQA